MNTPAFHSIPSRGVCFVFPKLVMPLWDDDTDDERGTGGRERERRVHTKISIL
jgi:hypothetical protein